jgi:hypothetical protein
MLPKNLETINLSHLRQFVSDRATESQILDFKRDSYRLNNTNADDKKKQCKEFLKDASAFANTRGGDLILGIGEEKGAAASLVGIQTNDADGLKRQMIQVIRNGTVPKISFSIHTVHVKDDYHVFIIRVRQSGHLHRVVYQGEQGGFFARNSGGVHEMDAHEVTIKSQQSQTLKQKIERFRMDRVDAINNDEVPVELPSRHRMVLHLIPDESFCGFEIEQQDLLGFLQWMPMPHFTGGRSIEHNSEGMVSFDRNANLPSSGYVQLYRNGIVEAVANDVTFFLATDIGKKHRLFKTDYRRELPFAMENYLILLRNIGVLPPVWFSMSFVGLNGVEILSNDFLRSTGRPIREKKLTFPLQEIEDFAVDLNALLKPNWDKLWNAAGFPHSPAN